MIKTKFAKIAAVAGVFSVVAISGAQSFLVTDTGTYTLSSGKYTTTDVTGTTITDTLGYSIGNATLTFTDSSITTTPSAFTGTVDVALGSGGTLVYGLVGSVDTEGPAISLSGVLTLESSTTGHFAGYAGSGTLSETLYNGTTFSTLYSSVNAVPEPVSLAVLGLGGIGLLLRRRSA